MQRNRSGKQSGFKLQFSLRVLLLVVAVIAVPSAIYVNSIWRQRTAARTIHQLGGWVAYDYQYEAVAPKGMLYSDRLVKLPKVPTPPLVGTILGPDFTSAIVNVQLDASDCTDADLAKLQPLSQLRALDLEGSQVTDDGLKCLLPFTKLETLVLAHTNISDDGLMHLKSLRNLKRLYLSETSVTAAGVEAFKQKLPNCDVWR